MRQYITEDDWRELKQALESGYSPTLAAHAVGRAHGYYNEGDLRFALIEGVTALELAVNERVRVAIPKKMLLERAEAFWTLPLKARVVMATGMVKDILSEDVEGALRAIRIRDAVVHEGKTPGDEVKQDIRRLLRTTGHLIGGLPFKFPRLPIGNVQYGAWA